MITHIRTVGFKGFDLDEDVPQKVVYLGKNKSGKSTRAAAIALALYGNIPFLLTGKKPGDIFAAYADGESLIVSVKIGETEFARKIFRNAKGGISQSVQINKKKASAENFAIHLNRAGSPRIADVAEFMKQSEAKKVDTLFELFPNDKLVDIDQEIEKAKEDVSRLEKKKAGAESTIVRLTNSKNEIQLPSGSISEIQAEIKDIETKIIEAEEEIKQAEIEEAKIKAKADGEQQEKDRAKKEAEQKALEKIESLKQPVQEPIINQEQQQPALDLTGSDDSMIGPPKNQMSIAEPGAYAPKDQLNPSESINKIINAMKSVGCETCAALIVAKQELKKYV